MGHHRRGRAKNQRAGCLLCKPHKANGAKGGVHAQTRQELKGRVSALDQLDSYWDYAVDDVYDAWWYDGEDLEPETAVIFSYEKLLDMRRNGLSEWCPRDPCQSAPRRNCPVCHGLALVSEEIASVWRLGGEEAVYALREASPGV